MLITGALPSSCHARLRLYANERQQCENASDRTAIPPRSTTVFCRNHQAKTIARQDTVRERESERERKGMGEWGCTTMRTGKTVRDGCVYKMKIVKMPESVAMHAGNNDA